LHPYANAVVVAGRSKGSRVLCGNGATQLGTCSETGLSSLLRIRIVLY
jgi:hypothetical protein